VTLLTDTCPGLVAQIEAGRLDSPETRAILEKALAPMLARGIDTVVLGCTHYPFVIPLIEEISGPGVRVIDPAPAVARQVARLSEAHRDRARIPSTSWPAPARYLTTGDPLLLQTLLPRLAGENGMVEGLCWTSAGLKRSI
jgi:glutamate racemase